MGCMLKVQMKGRFWRRFRDLPMTREQLLDSWNKAIRAGQDWWIVDEGNGSYIMRIDHIIDVSIVEDTP